MQLQCYKTILAHSLSSSSHILCLVLWQATAARADVLFIVFFLPGPSHMLQRLTTPYKVATTPCLAPPSGSGHAVRALVWRSPSSSIRVDREESLVRTWVGRQGCGQWGT